MSARCRACGIALVRSRGRLHDRVRTVDHILARRNGGSDAPENLRIVCRGCNETLAELGQCLGALAAMRAVIGRRPVAECIRWWRQQGEISHRMKLLEATRPENWCAPLPAAPTDPTPRSTT